MGELHDAVRAFLDDPEEGPLLRRVMTDPRDRETRVLYRKLLQQRDDPRAGLVFGRLPFDDQRALLRAAEVIDKPDVSAWFAFVQAEDIVAPIRNCGLGKDWGEERFAFECPRSWDSLATTSDAKVRSCDACKQQVYFCDDDDELVANAAQGRCVAMNAPEEAHLAARAARERAGTYTGRPRPVDHLAALVRRRQS